MAVKSYSSKEKIIFFCFMVPYTVLINLLIFGKPVFNDIITFTSAFFISVFYFAFIYILFGIVARIIRRRYPDDSLLFRRIAIMLPVFFVLNLFMLQGLFLFYELMDLPFLLPARDMEWWATGFTCVISIVVTLINEAAVGWDNWKNSIRETEQIKKAYQKTKLMGLKGQVNPHFLFNCFNSLSSLISEDAARAEKFLDEMTKVHRYMLRNDDEQMTDLREEITFTHSYLFLIKERFGEAIHVSLNIDPEQLSMYLPPLSMQVILENIIYNNTATKGSPLSITIETAGNYLQVQHSVHLKTTRQESIEEEEGLDNLVRKYALLNNEPVQIRECGKQRIIVLPLLTLKKEMVS